MKRTREAEAEREYVVRRSLLRCEVRAEGCTVQADGLHHRFKPGRIDTRANLVAVCDACHTQSPAAIHRNVAASVNSGLLRRSWDGLPTEPWVRGQAPVVPYGES